MKITICGSMHYQDEMTEMGRRLEAMGYEADVPDIHEGFSYEGKSPDDQAALKDGFMRAHFDKITASDAILVYNKTKHDIEGYIGGNTLMEMAFAYAQSLEIFLLNPVPEVSYASEIRGMQPIVLNEDIAVLDGYFKGLPVTYVSSKSPIKLRAVSRGLRRAGIRTQVLPRPVASGVAEQPYSIEETYEGAANRQFALAESLDGEMPAYIATIESGNHKIHPRHNTFGCSVVILEKIGGERKVGIHLDLEFPKEMTDKVPSMYPDLGALVQAEFGSKLKDPFPYFTGGKINRLKIVEDAVFDVAVQF